ncbi:MAG: hypothetical protein CSH37_06250 [Thalassolituus sp.]|jgi:hypothetical protein|nr:MAG: hypothetical protein CSH37_06250 [Thalassolituus sp.]
MKFRFILLLMLGLLDSMAAMAADDVVRLQGMTIRGNSENPNVLYINAWQPPPGTGRLYEPVTSFNRHWFRPLTRDSLLREIRYGKQYTEKEDHVTRLNEVLEIQ